MSDTLKSRRAARPRWVFATVGVFASGVAVLGQFLFPGPNTDAIAGLPEFVRTAGKLPVTIPLLVLGLGLISRDAIKNMHRGTPVAAPPLQVKSRPKVRAVQPTPLEEEEMFAEEICDDLPPPPMPAATPSPGGKIRARFVMPATADAPQAPPPTFRNPNAEGGTVALSTAKYLNNGKPDFRKGSVRHTQDPTA